ncbi:high-affinity methionine permease [Podospora fimiseda]|uniref:High-affinity methionine permease n=1 Tax=Podospora fimiseda TaxID=252190 RepID=A0AAN6YP09_9PEZI|nr:high-affinity methionine permease [Podospora fimiseda]
MISLSDFGAPAPAPLGPFKPRPTPAEVDPEQTPWRRGALETFDVFSLIANKMIGTGIYSAPATVFLLTGNKSLTLGLFGVGFFYSLISMVMYLDYAAAWPFNGGELVYLDEITAHAIGYDDEDAAPILPDPITEPTSPPQSPRQQTPIQPNTPRTSLRHRIKTFLRKFLGDGLLAYVTYSLSFIGVFNSGTNSMQTGRMILICIAASDTASGTASDINRHVARLIGVVVLTTICLVQFFSPNTGRKLNRFLATVKILFLVALFIVAASATSKPKDPAKDWFTWHTSAPRDGRAPTPKTWVTFAKALLAVLFSFEGWENATFVTGEIPRDKQYVLRRGFIAGVCTVGVLYLLVVAVFLNSISWEALDAARSNVHYAALLTGDGVTAKQAWAVIGAISSIGSLNSIIYTFSRVKQVIGQAEVIPWSKIWKQDDRIERSSSGGIIANNDPHAFIHKAPQGGLIIHWVMSIVVIAGSSSIPATIESVQLPGYIQTYAHCFILMVLGAAYLNLSNREWAVTPPRRDLPGVEQRKPPFRPSQAESSVAQWFLRVAVILYVLTNLAILIINALGPYVGSDGSSVSFKGFGFPIIVGAILLFSTAYYLLVFGNARRIYPQSPVPGNENADPLLPIRENGIYSHKKWSLLNMAGVECEIVRDRYHNPNVERVYRFGRRWRIMYYLPGERPLYPGDADPPNDRESTTTAGGNNDLGSDRNKLTWKIFLYWLFGGDRLRETPAQRFSHWWNKQKWINWLF